MAVLVFNPNPVFDRTITVHELIPGAVLRTLDVEITAGGKGINVARALRALGKSVPLIIPIGTDDRVRYEHLLVKEGADAQFIDVSGPVRIASIYLERVSKRVTVVNDAGHPMNNSDWTAVQAGVVGSVRAGDTVLIMGSFPPGLDPECLCSLMEALHLSGAQVLLDVNPRWLAASLTNRPDVVTPNLEEAEATLSESIANVMDAETHDENAVQERAERAALSLCERGAQRAFVTAGASGVAMANAGVTTWFPAYRIDAVSTVGAGDSFVAGLVHVWSATAPGNNIDWSEAARFGIATSANSCENIRAGGVDPIRVEQIVANMREVATP